MNGNAAQWSTVPVQVRAAPRRVQAVSGLSALQAIILAAVISGASSRADARDLVAVVFLATTGAILLIALAAAAWMLVARRRWAWYVLWWANLVDLVASLSVAIVHSGNSNANISFLASIVTLPMLKSQSVANWIGDHPPT